MLSASTREDSGVGRWQRLETLQETREMCIGWVRHGYGGGLIGMCNYSLLSQGLEE